MNRAAVGAVAPDMAPIHLLNHSQQRWLMAIDAWSDWLTVAGARPRTIELRRYQIGHLAESFLRRSPWSLRAAELIDWQARQRWAPATRRSYRSALRSFYGWARTAEYNRSNPALTLPPVRVVVSPPRPAPDHVLAAALATTSDRDRLMLLLAAYAGLRRAEIAGLAWEDITPERIWVLGKGGRVRLVPLHPILAAALDAERRLRNAARRGSGYQYRPGQQARWVFPGQGAGPMTPGAVGKAAGRALGPGWTGHTLRHRFATRAYAGSHDLLAVQALLGHTNPETTKRYTELSGDALAAAVRTV